MLKRCLPAAAAGLATLVVSPASEALQTPALSFVEHVIAGGLRGGYQVVAADLNRDRRPDLIALASGLDELVWYENPGWQRHVIAATLSGMINVAAHDVDGDGIPELALATEFSTRPDRSAGVVSILTHRGDPTDRWSMREIDRTPSAHRLRWVDPDGSGHKLLVNAPLAGAEAEPPEYRGPTSIFAYDPDGWTRSTVTDAEAGVVHGVEAVAWTSDGDGEVLLSAGFLGVHRYGFSGDAWRREEIHRGDPSAWPSGGASEIALGRMGAARYLATIEPWHGHQLVVYRADAGSWRRQVVDDALDDGHALVVGDFDGDGGDEIVAGERRGSRVTVYRRDAGTGSWSAHIIDDGGVGAAGCAIADLDLDGDNDLTCIGSATANLKWYENVTRE